MHEKKINTLLEFKNYYMQNPDYFIEDFFGVKLSPYQKIMLKVIDKLQTINLINSNKKLEYYLRVLQRLVSLEEDSKVAFYHNNGYKEMARNDAIIYILGKLGIKL